MTEPINPSIPPVAWSGPLAVTAEWAGDSDWEAELLALQAEAMGWQPLGEDAYLHAGAEHLPEQVAVVGVPTIDLQGQWALLLA